MRKASIVVLLLLWGCASNEPALDGEPDLVNPGSGGRATGAGGSAAAGAGGAQVAREAGAGGAKNPGSGGAATSGSGGRATGAGGSGAAGAGGAPIAGVTVTVSPKVGTVGVGRSQTLSAAVTGSSDTDVAWSVTEAACGSVTSEGDYTAPAAVPTPAYCHVRATSHADPTRSDTATLTISAGSTGAAGVWEDVTPGGITSDPSAFGGNNFGVQDVVLDPVRPSDLYAFTCYQGVWRSTDFGKTWDKSSAAGSDLEKGRQWAAAIDSDANRDPEKAPTLYTTNGYGAPDGLFVSTDWGVSFARRSDLIGIYSIDMDPYDNQHLLVGFHEAPGVAESTDGGATWRQIGTPDSGNSIYAFFIDTGNAAMTRTTWLAIPQDSSGGRSHRTTNSGAAWSAFGGAGHAHGSCQILQTGGGVVYATLSPSGISRSTDYGVNWSLVSSVDDSAIVATRTTLYASMGPNYTSSPPKVQSAPRDPGTSWSMMTVPGAMKHGAKRLAVTNDGSHEVIVAGSWMSGIWRYVQP